MIYFDEQKLFYTLKYDYVAKSQRKNPLKLLLF